MNRTWVLKVSIHCEGCKKKIKKVLQKVEGVYTIDIDSKQNTVTVNGDVDGDSLVRKLLKYGKHAELLPEKNHTTANSATAATAAGDGEVNPKNEEKVAVVFKTEQKQNEEQGKNAVTSDTPPETSSSGEVPASSSGENTPKLENPATTDKKREDKRKDVEEEENRGDVATAVGRTPANHFTVEPPPAYTMSYSTINPTTSYAFYEPPPATYGYAAYPPPANYSPEYYPSESYYGSVDPTASSAGSYDMFNEENPNACNLM